MGGCGIDNTEFNTFNSIAGPLQVRRTFDGSLPSSFSASKAGPDINTGRLSMWSWKPNMTTFATDTAAQNAFKTFLGTVPANHDLIVAAYHEPEDNIAAGSFTLAQFKAVTNKVGQLIKDVGNPRIKFAFIIMGAYTFDSGGPYAAWDWDSGWNWNVIDYVGVDPYRFKPTEPSMKQMLTVANFGRGGAGLSCMQRLQAWGKPIIIPEWACTETNVTLANKAQWIRDAWAWMKEWNTAHPTQPIVAASYFNTDYFQNNGQPTASWELHDEPMDAFKAIMVEARA
jgi:hypothetical protein